MKVEKIDCLDFETVYKLMRSNKISADNKTQFIRTNKTQIKNILEFHLSSAEFDKLMENRPLQKFKPIKNSYTKYGDKIILAKSLGVQPNEIPDYIKQVTNDLKSVDKLTFLPADKLEQIKKYVYRHGSKDELLTFLDYELTKSEDILKTLYKTLEYHTGGVADYFIRPIHRLDNNTLVRVYNIVDKHLNAAKESGKVTPKQNDEIAKWALVQIYKIQNNNKFINAVKTVKTLNG